MPRRGAVLQRDSPVRRILWVSMRVVLINWARFAEGAQSGGGVNGYCRQLAIELVRQGHEVAWLSSGLAYVPGAIPGSLQACEVRRMDDCQGVQIYEVFNSPVLAPGIFQFREPLGEVSSPELEAELTRFFQLWKPDVVHLHNIEGLSCGVVDAARTAGPGWKGAAVVFSLHNYHTICPQVYLMHKGQTPCFDFDSGHACTQCVEGHDATLERRIRAGISPDTQVAARPASPPPPPAILTRVVGAVKRRLTAPVPLPVLDPPMPGRGLSLPADVEGSMPVAEAATPEPRPWSAEQFGQPSWRPLSNEIRPPASTSRALNDFGVRRKAMVDMLSRCDRVLAVSAFVRRKFESMGVASHVLREMPIGTRMVDLAQRTPWLGLPPSEPAAGRPVRLAFMGYNNTYKGLGMLLDALDLLTPECQTRLELFIWAKDIEKDLARIESFRGRLAGVHVKGSYRFEDVPGMLSGIDAGLVPSVWWDNGPQTVMEYLACGVPVIGAALGGIVDLVRDGENGLLFRGNDRFHLAATLARIGREPQILATLRQGVTTPRSISEHAIAMEAEYRAMVAARKHL